MDAVGQLAGGIAHDFNNILTVIQGYTELIGCQGQLDAQTRAYAKQIAVSAERASKLTRQLLTFSRKQVMQLKTGGRECPAQHLARNAPAPPGRTMPAQSTFQADLPAVRLTPGCSSKCSSTWWSTPATPCQGRQADIETSLHQIDDDYCRIHPEAEPGQFLCLGVIDTGSGMAPETSGTYLNLFSQPKKSGAARGLGLPTVYGIVKQHQGWIQSPASSTAAAPSKFSSPSASQVGCEFPASARKARSCRRRRGNNPFGRRRTAAAADGAECPGALRLPDSGSWIRSRALDRLEEPQPKSICC